MRKKVLIAGLIVIWGVLGWIVFDFTKKEEIDLISPMVSKVTEGLDWPEKFGDNSRETLKEVSVFDGEVLNILLVGIDTSEGRRARGQGGFNTDTMILASVDTTSKRILLTSVPRDLWINGNKLNALYIVYGEDTLVDAFEKVTGMKVDGVIRADFDHITWLVDAFGGVPIEVKRSFTDVSFPNIRDSGTKTLTFTEGFELMDGARALDFTRSRKGSNGEGSDLMRAKRQHLVLSGLIEAISQENSTFWPMNVGDFYKAITSAGKMYTTLTLADVKYLWDFYKDRDEYIIESFVVDGEYVYHPGMYPDSAYSAWVFIAREPGFSNLHRDIKAKLQGTFVGDSKIIRKTPLEEKVVVEDNNNVSNETTTTNKEGQL